MKHVSMDEIAAASRNEFIDELLEILDRLEEDSRSIAGSGDAALGHLQCIERSLHTIKGNADAFDLELFGDVTYDVLEYVREVQQEDDGQIESSWKGGARLITEYCKRSRFFAQRLSADFDHARECIGDLFKELMDEAETLHDCDLAVLRGAVQPEAWEDEVDRILAAAPSLERFGRGYLELVASARRQCGLPVDESLLADVEALTDSALVQREPIEKPEAECQADVGGQGTVQERQRKSGSGARDERLDKAFSKATEAAFTKIESDVHSRLKIESCLDAEPDDHDSCATEATRQVDLDALAFEARRIILMIDSQLQAPESDAVTRSARELLATLRTQYDETASLQFAAVLELACRRIETLSDAVLPHVRIERVHAEQLVPPGLASLAADSLEAAFAAGLPLRSGQRESRLEVELTGCVRDLDDRPGLELRLLDFGALARSSAQKSLSELRLRLARLGGDLTVSNSDAGVTLWVPWHVDLTTVRVARRGDVELALPEHRVRVVLDADKVRRLETPSGVDLRLADDRVVPQATLPLEFGADLPPGRHWALLDAGGEVVGLEVDEVWEPRQAYVVAARDPSEPLEVFGRAVPLFRGDELESEKQLRDWLLVACLGRGGQR